ncbi:prolyl 4-hydroxylase subunit alpha-1-like [Lingula anatina]|uniref:procollagen-proline 4-dioxygenase n=1 Tax=Lingula anatina TaxID=7574 RepID=A0A1S3K7W7_LINAN|nr:prolyl 4-hydroxylase subunit alpha-1-like [Lingula anatina]|eukprot:XP_013418730.1 prolyl 4-hydroxylase subunit alpha-1-like [Lingula anatina]
MEKVAFCFGIFLSVFVISSVRGEVYSSIIHLERSLLAEKELAGDIRNYVQNQKTMLDALSRVADEYEKHSEEALANSEKFMGNPVNAYLFMKRFTVDWDGLRASLENENSEVKTLMSKFEQVREEGRLPKVSDLEGAAAALLRLQDTYQLNTSDIADGVLHGVKRSPGLTATDCFNLGKYAYDEGDNYHCLLWMQEALRRLEKENNSSVSRYLVLDYLAFATYNQGNVQHAFNITKEMLEIDPNDEKVKNNHQFLIRKLAEDEDGEEKGIDNKRPIRGYRDEEYDAYEKLCRGEETKPRSKSARKLTCRYEDNKNANLLLRPIKLEVLNLKPLIVKWHDIMTEFETERVKEIATPRLNRATVHNPVTGEHEHVEYRVSKSVFLDGSLDPVLARIDRRIADISGLDMTLAEQLQVNNYGMGGQYEPHYDFGRKSEPDIFGEMGNRIATVLIYMSDVEAGGATVFTRLGVQVLPEKASAVFWYNLRQSGIGDYRTRHAACPVLSGSKWVCNKWIHSAGQEFRRKCATNPKL